MNIPKVHPIIQPEFHTFLAQTCNSFATLPKPYTMEKEAEHHLIPDCNWDDFPWQPLSFYSMQSRQSSLLSSCFIMASQSSSLQTSRNNPWVVTPVSNSSLNTDDQKFAVLVTTDCLTQRCYCEFVVSSKLQMHSKCKIPMLGLQAEQVFIHIWYCTYIAGLWELQCSRETLANCR